MRFPPSMFPARGPKLGTLRCIGAMLIRHPWKRLRGLHRDDEGQVMVMTGVMVFVVGLIAISSLNTSELLYNRIRTQTAADAAADAFAIWQARAFNMNQHINDKHYEILLVYYADTILTCLSRFIDLSFIGYVGACQKQYRSPGCNGCTETNLDWNLGGVRNCCRAVNARLTTVEGLQAVTSMAILTVQGFIDVVGPAVGWLAANRVAEGSGADELDAVLIQEIEDTLFELTGFAYDINAVKDNTLIPPPPGPLYTVPLRVPLMTMVPAPTAPMGNVLAALPPWMAGGPTGGRCVIPALHDIGCMVSTCGSGGSLFCMAWTLFGGIIPNFIGQFISPSSACTPCYWYPPLIPLPGPDKAPYWCTFRTWGVDWPCTILPNFPSNCRFLMNDLNECDYACTPSLFEFGSTVLANSCGWHDTWFEGKPAAHTWMTANTSRNIGGSALYDNLRWFNPVFGRSDPLKTTFDQDDHLRYSTSGEYVFDQAPISRPTSYKNEQFMAMASCTARGNTNFLLQPLTMYSEFLKPIGFEYSRPQMINVHLDPPLGLTDGIPGLTDSVADENIIWH